MDPTEAALLRGVLESPDDDLPRLVLADWWDEHGQAERAEFVRLQVQLKLESVYLADAVGRWTEAEVRAAMARYDRQRVLLGVALHQDWAGFPASWDVTDWRFERGFIDRVELPFASYLRHAEALFRRHPIEDVTLTDAATASGWSVDGGAHRIGPFVFRLPETVERARRGGDAVIEDFRRICRAVGVRAEITSEWSGVELSVNPRHVLITFGRQLASLSRHVPAEFRPRTD